MHELFKIFFISSGKIFEIFGKKLTFKYIGPNKQYRFENNRY